MNSRRWKVSVRELRENEIGEVVALWYETWHANLPGLTHTDPIEEWERRLRETLSHWGVGWVAEATGRIVGFIVLLPGERYVDQLFVAPTFQRHGIGTRLLEKARELCPEGLWLHALIRNDKAGAFYTKHGFVAGAKGVNKINGQPNVEYRWNK